MFIGRLQSDRQPIRPSEERDPRVLEVLNQRDDVVCVAVDVVRLEAGWVVALTVTAMVEENAGVFLGKRLDIARRAP